MGNWITPHFDSLAYLDKPAVFFWLVAGSFRLWGVSEWAARFPSALMALATMLLTWALARRMFGKSSGLRAGIIFATTPMVMVLSRMVIFDMTLACLVTLAMLAFWHAESSQPRPRWAELLAFAAMGLATMTKGPVGFLLPLLSLALYYALSRRLRDFKRLNWGWGIAALLLTALPWFLLVSARNPDFPRYAFWQESLLRFATGHAHRSGSIFYYVPVFLAGMFPWSLLLAVIGLTRLVEWGELTRETRKPVLFLLTWAGVVFVFFSISRSKLPTYFLPAIVPLSILLAELWSAVDAATGRAPSWLRAGFATLILAGLLIASSSQLFLLDSVRHRVEQKIPTSLVAMIKPTLLYGGVIVLALAWLGRDLAARLRGRLRSGAAFALLALAAPILVVRSLGPLMAYARFDSSRPMATTILSSPERDLPLYGFYYFRTGLPFYLHCPVGLVTADGAELTSRYIASRLAEIRKGEKVMMQLEQLGQPGGLRVLGNTCPLGLGPVVIDAAELRRRSRSMPMLLMVRNNEVANLMQSVGTVEPRWSSWEYSIWKIPGPKIEGTK